MILLTVCLHTWADSYPTTGYGFTCSRSMRSGSSIMGRTVAVSSDRYAYMYIFTSIPFTTFLCSSVRVKRGGLFLSSGDEYSPGETLTVSISNSGGETVLQSSGGASFSGGTCSNTRYRGSSRTITMPTDGSTVKVWAGWATCRCQVCVCLRNETIFELDITV